MDIEELKEMKENLAELAEKFNQLKEEVRILNNNYRFDIGRAFEEIDRINGIGGDANESTIQ